MTKLEEVKEICTRLLLIPFEGTGPMTSDGRFIAYKDPATKNDPIKQGKPITIAWGLTYHPDGTPIQLGETWDYNYAVKAKQQVLNKFLVGLLRLSPSLIEANPNQIAAVLSWVYNLGLGNYRISTFKKKIDRKAWLEAAEQCKRWDKAGGRIMRGLTRRRAAEAALLTSYED